MLVYATWAIVQCFNGKGSKAIFKASLAVQISMVFYFLLTMVVGFAIRMYS
jgi:hypothetical protein